MKMMTRLTRLGQDAACLTLATVLGLSASTGLSQENDIFPPVTLLADDGGPVQVIGEWSYSSAIVRAHFVEPVAVLLNISRYVAGDNSDWVPVAEQAVGRITSPLSEPPVSFEVNIPIELAGARVDVDNDGEVDDGVQIYGLSVASNLNGDSYLQQFDQTRYDSFLRDPVTGLFREGTFLVHAADDAQGFPSGFGTDGIYFTDDDPVVGLPKGYTLATLSRDGVVTFDRSRFVRMDTREPTAVSSPDFSDQGILESYSSLIDLLEERYAYTELRGLDWEEIRTTYEPQIVAADSGNDHPAYFLALTEMARSIRDSHVDVTSNDAAIKFQAFRELSEPYSASLGARGTELDDGRFIITYVVPDSPAAGEGWGFGTEILSVNDEPIAERIGRLPLPRSIGTDEGARLAQSAIALGFSEGETPTIEYLQPGAAGPQTVSLTAVSGLEYPSNERFGELIQNRELDGGYWYVTWSQFVEPDYMLAVWQRFLGSRLIGAPGVVIDLRGNRGGNVELLYTMASYFFSEDNPASFGWVESYIYDEETGDLVKEFSLTAPVYAPKPELLFNGAVVVLVDERTASAGEYFPQFLQYHDRAIVVGEHRSSGAGGYLERVALPGNIQFDFTKSRTFFAGTQEVNLQGKGVALDVRVPVTEANERVKTDGGDPVLEAAIEALEAEGVRIVGNLLTASEWKLTRISAAPGAKAQTTTPDGYLLSFDGAGNLNITTDCNLSKATYEIGAGEALTITPTISTLAACPDTSLGEEFIEWLSSAVTVQTDGNGLFVATHPASGVIGLLFERIVQ